MEAIAQLRHPRDACAAPARADARGHLVGPWADPLLLGGGSLLLFPLALLTPPEWVPSVLVAVVLLANVVNHPHFAHSYQILYRGFAARLADPALPPALRRDYVLAGIVVPVLLLVPLLGAAAVGDLGLLGLAGHAMTFLVGWHYVKQGYGILMVDAALKRRFFSPAEKRLLLLNAHAVWIASWISINAMLHDRALWGVQYVLLPMPEWAMWIGWAAAAATGALLLAAGLRRRAPLPWTGLLAYAVSIYLWLALLHVSPVWLLLVPVFHSLQYLPVVWRFEANRASAAPDAREPVRTPLLARLFRQRWQLRVAGFVAIGIVLGFVMFWALPVAMQVALARPQLADQALAWLFVAWVFFNIHHYAIDGVIWRSGNPETRRFLFG